MKDSYVIGIDLGGTNTRLGLVNSYGSVIEYRHFATNASRDSHDVIEEMSTHIKELKQLGEENVSSIGMGVPGQVNLYGVIDFAPNLKWSHIPLKNLLSAQTGLPVVITNDVRAATWGEWMHGAGQYCNDLATILVGTGIGAGLISQGKMIEGYSNTAGEIGHMIVQVNGPICTCGNRGCLEAIASGWAIAKAAQTHIEQYPQDGKWLLDKVEGNKKKITAKLVIEAYHENDLLAEKIIQNMLQALTAGCVNIVNTFNPERLILGGGVLSGLPEAIVHVQMGVFKHALNAATRTLDILPVKLAHDAGIIGAAAYARNTLSQIEVEC